MERREFIKLMLAATGGSLTWATGASAGTGRMRHRRVMALAFDGLDPRIVHKLMDQGRLPNMKRVAEMGAFRTMATSTPAQTPVAFSNIIGGNDPQTHGIFDFIHRKIDHDKGKISASFALCGVEDPTDGLFGMHELSLGEWKVPLASQRTVLHRKGPSFWDTLLKAGSDVSVFHLPGTYPPPDPKGSGRFHCLSGMGTPDIIGNYGQFTMFESDRLERKVTGGGIFEPLSPDLNQPHRAETKLEGPTNFLHKGEAKLDFRGNVKRNDKDQIIRRPPQKFTAPIVFTRDPEADVMKIEFAGRTMVLNQGEWSEWIQFEFDTDVPGGMLLGAMQAPTKLPAIVRFFVKQVHPEMKVYATPMNFDPYHPANAISTPRHLAAEIAEASGLYYTTGMPEDTKALRDGAINEDEFISHCDLIWDEKFEQTRQHLKQFVSGCMFNYVGTTDLMQHIFWRDRDPDHPGRLADQGDTYADVVNQLYVRSDQMVGEVLDELREEDVLMILSDHGFTTFRKGLNVNTWLLENDLLRLHDPTQRSGAELLSSNAVDWSQTYAYAIGLNAMYLNLKDREHAGIVSESERRALMEKIAEGLMAFQDDNGAQVVERVDFADDLYPEGLTKFRDIMPDFFIGYAEKYRVSWDTSLGSVPRNLMEINDDRWSGTHCIAPNRMPGIMICNQPILRDDLILSDVAATIIGASGLDVPPDMIGRNVLSDIG